MKLFTTIAVSVFGIVALLHLHRLVFGWEVIVAGWSVPRWLSTLGTLIAGFLAVMLLLEKDRPTNEKIGLKCKC